MTDDRAHLEKLLKTYTRNKQLLENQAANFGGEDNAPVHVVNQLDAVRAQIADIQQKLAALGTAPTSGGSSGGATSGGGSSGGSVINFQGNDMRGASTTISGNVAGGNIVSGQGNGGTSQPSVNLPELRNLFVQFFNDDELRDVCFDLGVDYDSLAGGNKAAKARELVAYAQRTSIVSDLIAAGRRIRPNAPWPTSATTVASPTATAPPEAPSKQPEPTANTLDDLPKQKPTSTATPNQVTLAFSITGEAVMVTWGSPLLGHRVTKFIQPYTDEALPTVVKALDAVQYPNYPLEGPQFTSDEQAILTTLNLWQSGRISPNVHKLVGHAIYQALGPDGMNALEAVRNFAINTRQQTSYVLRFPQDAVEIAALPWEGMIDSRGRAVLLTSGNNIDSCERYMNIDQAVPPPLVGGQTPHILALSPSYKISNDVRNAEREARLATWDALKAKGLLTYDEVGSPLTVRTLNDYLRHAERQPDIVHYFGHGTYRDGKGYLLFDNGTGGKSLVSADRLASILGDVRLLVIMACESARFEEEGGLLTGIAPALSLVTGAVVAMQLTTRISAATRFAEVFYDELLNRKKSLQDAVAEGRQTLYFEEDDGASWYVPTIYIRSQKQEPVYITR